MEDAGPVIPWARKHIATSTGPVKAGGATLAELWPEPDWAMGISSGAPADMVAVLAMTYGSLAKSPRTGGFGLYEEQWRSAYIEAIAIMQELFIETDTVEQAQELTKRFAARYRTTPQLIVKRPIRDVAPYWAAGQGGNRSMRPTGEMTYRRSMLARKIHLLGWPADDSVLRTNLLPMPMKDGTWRIVKVSSTGFTWDDKLVLATEAAAIEATIEKSRALLQSAVAVKKKPGTGAEERVGPDHRHGKAIKPEELMREFGIRAVQFGESLPDKEAQRWMNDLYDAMADLALVLDIPRRWIGLGGIAIAVGARGSGSAVAHYETGLRVVNFTRRRGAGSLSHEWAHALDHRLTRRRDGIESRNYLSKFATALPSGEQTPIEAAMWRFVRSIYRTESSNWTDVSGYFKQSAAITQLPRAESYWTSIEELVARSFEAYVEDAIRERGWVSPYLVAGTCAADYADHLEVCPYPLGAERTALNKAAAALIGTLRESKPAS